MSDQNSFTLQALPDGGAGVQLVLRLSWEDLGALGREAGRLAAQRHRPVSLDEAAVHALRSWSTPTAPPAPAPAAVAPPAEPQAKPWSEATIAPPSRPLTISPPSDQVRQPVQNTGGSAPASATAATSWPSAAVSDERARHAASPMQHSTSPVTSLAGRSAGTAG
jgi:hypothetical protein